MPRPGPRPYECVKRAWHSDRHQPTRGSIIQQIFRVAQESHSPGTKKNKEWQEKLPVVVLKAEEIMYSKANSEAEYMDLGTLWDRVNDAINTIIKRDESTETGDLLPPCIEAALNLGCVRVRASRSQRNANLRNYLGQKSQEPNNTTNERNPQLPSVHSGNQLPFPMRPSLNSTQSNRPLSMNSTQYNIPAGQHNSYNDPVTCCNSLSLRFEVPPLSNNQFIGIESNSPLNIGSFYPLHYGTHFHPEMPQSSFQVPRNPNAIIVGRPIFPSTEATTKKFFLQNLFTSERDESTSNIVSQADSRNCHGKAPESGFDLSLRLGLFEEPCFKPRRILAHDTTTVGLSSSHDRSLFSNPSPYPIKEFSFFPVEIDDDPFESHRIRWNSEGECQNADAASRKRKTWLDEHL